MKNLCDNHGIKGKGLVTIIEELNQRFLAKAGKITRHRDQMFAVEEKEMFKELNGETNDKGVLLDPGE